MLTVILSDIEDPTQNIHSAKTLGINLGETCVREQ